MINLAISSRIPAVTIAKVAISPQQRIAPLFLPHHWQYGGASQATRRFYCHKILNTVAVPVLPADKRGGNFATELNWDFYFPS